jgi:hypothetical protein
MDEVRSKEILRAILDSAGGWTGRSVLVRDLALKLGVSREEADEFVDELIASGLAWGTMDPSMGLTPENLGVCVCKKGRHLVDGFPDPHPDMWANAPEPDSGDPSKA